MCATLRILGSRPLALVALIDDVLKNIKSTRFLTVHNGPTWPTCRAWTICLGHRRIPLWSVRWDCKWYSLNWIECQNIGGIGINRLSVKKYSRFMLYVCLKLHALIWKIFQCAKFVFIPNLVHCLHLQISGPIFSSFFILSVFLYFFFQRHHEPILTFEYIWISSIPFCYWRDRGKLFLVCNFYVYVKK